MSQDGEVKLSKVECRACGGELSQSFTSHYDEDYEEEVPIPHYVSGAV